MGCFNFNSLFRRTGRGEEERMGSSEGRISVNRKYKEAFSSESFMGMKAKVQGQLGRKSHAGLASSSSLPGYLLEPPQETQIEGSNLHHLIFDYFEVSVEAYNTCELLLRGVYQARANYQIIKRVIKLTANYADYTDAQCHTMIKELASFAMLKNPLLAISTEKFRDTQDIQGCVSNRLQIKFRKVRRRVKVKSYCKKTAGYSLVVSYSALASALLALAVHSMVGIVAAPVLIACSLALVKTRAKLLKRCIKTSSSSLERLGAQLAVAARGVYILIRDFETMNPLVIRLQDVIEHSKFIAKKCVENGNREVLKEVVREFQIDQTGFQELLEELEKHIILCFLNINRSRRLVMQEIGSPTRQQHG